MSDEHTHPRFIVWSNGCPACLADDPDAEKALQGFVRVFDIDLVLDVPEADK